MKEYQSNVICPYCEYEMEHECQGEENRDIVCENCDKTFLLDVTISVDYSTYRNCKKNGFTDHKMKLDREYDYRDTHWKIYLCENDCDEQDIKTEAVKEQPNDRRRAEKQLL